MRLSVFFFRNKAKRYRHFALFNEQGRCIAFKTCERMPTHGQWIPVDAINLAWLDPAPSEPTLRSQHNVISDPQVTHVDRDTPDTD